MVRPLPELLLRGLALASRVWLIPDFIWSTQSHLEGRASSRAPQPPSARPLRLGKASNGVHVEETSCP